jgi:glycosyltransferase involved in cell wall biosynthesis
LLERYYLKTEAYASLEKTAQNLTCPSSQLKRNCGEFSRRIRGKLMSRKALTISVIIPTFQEEEYIGKLLTRLKKVSTPVEILVVDGGSQDETVKIAKRFTQKVYVADKRGIAHGKNIGAEHANGDILIFLDTDVVFPINFLEKTLRVFEDATVVGATCNIMPVDAGLGSVAFFYFYNRFLRILTRIRPHARGEFFAVKKKVFRYVNGFNETLPCLEDHELAIRLGKLGKFAFISNLTVYESLRRFKRLGFWHVMGTWFTDYVVFKVRGKPFSKVWKPAR